MTHTVLLILFDNVCVPKDYFLCHLLHFLHHFSWETANPHGFHFQLGVDDSPWVSVSSRDFSPILLPWFLSWYILNTSSMSLLMLKIKSIRSRALPAGRLDSASAISSAIFSVSLGVNVLFQCPQPTFYFFLFLLSVRPAHIRLAIFWLQPLSLALDANWFRVTLPSSPSD